MAYDIAQLKHTTLAPVDDAHAFWVCRGDHIRTVQDLANCLESLTPAQFHTHVNQQENHVATWVQDVLHNELLAHDLRYPANIEDQAHCVKTIRDHVHWLESA